MDVHAPCLIPVDDHIGGLSEAAAVLARSAGHTWLGARVPTCPDWDVLDLVAHQGMVHRWAIAAIRGDEAGMGNAALTETEGRTASDPIAWLRAGARELEHAFEQAPPDLQAFTFLKEAPSPKEFWARRQCHETTIHALDALAAETGRVARADDTWFGQDLAADGIDELLIGFWQRSRGGLRSTIPYAVHVVPHDAPVSWVVRVSDQPVRVRRMTAERIEGSTGADEGVPADALTLSGGAVDLYLALWNRGGTVDDPDEVLTRWREPAKITW